VLRIEAVAKMKGVTTIFRTDTMAVAKMKGVTTIFRTGSDTMSGQVVTLRRQ